MLIVGGGHNGLTCACYLARAGYRVRVLERRAVVGGAAVTEEFAPGFRNSVAAYTVSLLHPAIVRDLNLAEHGLTIVERPVANFLPLSDRDYLKIGATLAETQAEVGRFSRQDAAALPSYYAMLERAGAVLREMLLETPPNAGGGLRDAWRALVAGNRLRQLPMSARRDLLEFMTRSAGDILDGWFETDCIKALFGFDAVVGNFASPYSPGSGYVLLHHVIGEANGRRGQWGHAIGGMGAITQAMAKEAQRRGVAIRTGARVARVLVDGGRASGVVLEDGSEHRARCVAASVTPRRLYLELVEEEHLDPEFTRRIRAFRCGSGTFRMNVALSQLPRFTAAPPGEGDLHLKSGIILAPSLRYMEQAWFDARMHGWARSPVVEMLVPSTV
ncbi:MAG TPA: NAD(P)/FAD-dependent oxidoreductase, partial [Burkholderiales bacterium]|nr:NAD(P)/FAD-dependent oxidoreductase [Burkholderiales bacterium]